MDSAHEKLATVLGDMGLGSARVGFERDYFSAAHGAAIQHSAPKLAMVECTDLQMGTRDPERLS